jgi:flagellar protein FliS
MRETANDNTLTSRRIGVERDALVKAPTGVQSMSYSARGSVSQYNQVSSYTGVMEADPHQLVQMLLDGAVGRIAVAKGLIGHGDVAKKGEVISQVISIVGGLHSSLDMEAGGEISTNLDALYGYIERQLMRANLENSIAILDEVASLLREVRTAWISIRPESVAAEANIA